jgi:hypothetical protein
MDEKEKIKFETTQKVTKFVKQIPHNKFYLKQTIYQFDCDDNVDSFFEQTLEQLIKNKHKESKVGYYAEFNQSERYCTFDFTFFEVLPADDGLEHIPFKSIICDCTQRISMYNNKYDLFIELLPIFDKNNILTDEMTKNGLEELYFFPFHLFNNNHK